MREWSRILEYSRSTLVLKHGSKESKLIARPAQLLEALDTESWVFTDVASPLKQVRRFSDSCGDRPRKLRKTADDDVSYVAQKPPKVRQRAPQSTQRSEDVGNSSVDTDPHSGDPRAKFQELVIMISQEVLSKGAGITDALKAQVISCTVSTARNLLQKAQNGKKI